MDKLPQPQKAPIWNMIAAIILLLAAIGISYCHSITHDRADETTDEGAAP